MVDADHRLFCVPVVLDSREFKAQPGHVSLPASRLSLGVKFCDLDHGTCRFCSGYEKGEVLAKG